MNNVATKSVLEQAPSTISQPHASDMASANEDCENRNGVQDFSFKSVNSKSKFNRLLTSAVLTPKQGFDLQKARDRNEPLMEVQKASLERFEKELLYGVRLSEAVLEYDDDGKGAKCFKFFEHVATNIIPCGFTKYLSLLASGEDGYYDLDTFTMMFLKDTFAAAELFDLSSHTFRADALFGPNSLQSFIDFVGSRPEVFIMLFNKKINHNLREDPTSQLISLLNFVGLRHVQVKSPKDDGEVRYKLDKTILDLLMSMINTKYSPFPFGDDGDPAKWEVLEPVDWDAAMKTWLPE